MVLVLLVCGLVGIYVVNVCSDNSRVGLHISSDYGCTGINVIEIIVVLVYWLVGIVVSLV